MGRRRCRLSGRAALRRAGSDHPRWPEPEMLRSRARRHLLHPRAHQHARPLCLHSARTGRARGAATAAQSTRFVRRRGLIRRFSRGRRLNAGLARARAQGVVLGRPKVTAKVEADIRAALAGGVGILRTAKALGVGTSVVQRVKGEMAVSFRAGTPRLRQPCPVGRSSP